jgi:hypothetical protein
MKTNRNTAPAWIVCALLLAGGPVMAENGYSMNQHPLRGNFPTAEAADSDASAAEEVVTAFSCEVIQGEVEAVADGVAVLHGAGDMWTCPMKQASASPALIRVFLPIPE